MPRAVDGARLLPYRLGVTSRVVCLSGPDGAQMREVAQSVAERLGFTVVDEEIILNAAARAGIDPDVVSDVERRRSFMERALRGLGSNTEASAIVHADIGLVGSDAQVSGELRDLIRTAIEETAERGSAVIVAHAASHALASRPDVLRVLVTGSPSIRGERVAAELELSEPDAERVVARSDAARADYLKRFYDAKSELPTHYDLVVNTDRLSAGEAASLVVLAAGD